VPPFTGSNFTKFPFLNRSQLDRKEPGSAEESRSARKKEGSTVALPYIIDK